MGRIFIDTQGFAALKHQQDSFHHRAVSLYRKLCEGRAAFVTTNFVIDETLTLLRIRVGHWLAVEFGDEIRSRSRILTIVSILPDIEEAAWEIFRRHNSNLKWSYTDCTSFVVMKELEIEDAFTNDHNFEQAKFVKLL